MKLAPKDRPDDDPIYDAIVYLIDKATDAVRADNLQKSEQIMRRAHDIAKRLPKSTAAGT